MTTVTWDGIARGYVPTEQLRIDPGLALHDAASADVDPVTFEVIRYALLNANVEHGQTLQRDIEGGCDLPPARPRDASDPQAPSDARDRDR